VNQLVVDDIILNALKEDIPNTDISCEGIISKESLAEVDLLAKEEGILAGLDIFKRVFILLGDVEVEFYKKDGDTVVFGDKIGKLRGNTRNILMGERTALNLLQRLCGIATLTSLYVEAVSGTKAKVLDTRKTTPNLRVLEKYAVTVGGGYNHRFNLSDGVLLKDNHIEAAGGVKKSVELAKKASPFVRKIEVEVESLEMVNEALEAGADIIMLDNMGLDTIKKAVSLIADKAIIEVSGNVSLDNIGLLAKTGVDYISIGKLTHSAKILDLSMKNLKNIS